MDQRATWRGQRMKPSDRPAPEVVALHNAISDGVSRELTFRAQIVSAHFEIADLRAQLEELSSENDALHKQVAEMRDRELNCRAVAVSE